MPLNFAFFAIDRAEEVIAAEDGIDTWVVGGHSLGGAMATSHLGRGGAGADVDGLLLWASYPTEGAGLDARDDLAALSVVGDRDRRTTLTEVEQRRHLLPPAAELVVIEGMNHAQFGAYGEQARDGEPAISDRDAAAALGEATAAWLSER